MADYVQIFADDAEIPIKDFVQVIVGQGCEGLVKALRGVPEGYKELKIIILPDNKPEDY
ncbi:MAG TPA: hypothetical protein VKK79_06200 [Candidatus Lokiarchaeia archaeon]|nr:hypothetical protein [Candidatus Lokiarchaeia archaeon]